MRASPLKIRVCVVLSLGPLLNLYAFVCHVLIAYFASQTSGLCNAFPSVPFEVCTLMFLMLCYAYFASQTWGLCSAFALGSLLSLYAYVSRFVIRTSPHKLRVCAVLAPRFPLEFCTRAFSCFACFASQTPGLCSAFPSAPFEFVRLCLSRFVMRTLPHKHRVFAVLFSPHSQKIRTRDHAPVLI